MAAEKSAAAAPSPDVAALQKENDELRAKLASVAATDKSVVSLTALGLTEKQARKVPQHKARFAELRASQKKAAKA